MKHLFALTLLLAATVAPAQAATITRTFAFEASNFTVLGDPGPAPVDPVVASFTITFDPAADTADTTLGITVDALNLSVPDIGFSYNSVTDTIVVGGMMMGVADVMVATDDFIATIVGAAGEWLVDFAYVASGLQQAYFAETVSPTVPEPASLAILSMGLLGLVTLRRRRD